MKPIDKIEYAFSRLSSILDAAGALGAEATQRAVYELRLEIVRALGDADRIRVAEQSLRDMYGDDAVEVQGQAHPEAIQLAKRLADDEFFISRLCNMKYFTYVEQGDEVIFGDNIRNAVELVLGCALEEFTHEPHQLEVGLRIARDDLSAAQARMQTILSGKDELLPGACIDEIGHVDMLAILGEYDGPRQQPAWAWIESNACFSHCGNGVDSGVWEFILNMSLNYSNVPTELARVIVEAKDRGLVYLVFHQG